MTDANQLAEERREPVLTYGALAQQVSLIGVRDPRFAPVSLLLALLLKESGIPLDTVINKSEVATLGSALADEYRRAKALSKL